MWSAKEARCVPVNCWEIIADNLHDTGWSLDWISAVDREGRTIRIVDAHGYGNRFVVRGDEILTTFVKLELAIQGCGYERTHDRGRTNKTLRRFFTEISGSFPYRQRLG